MLCADADKPPLAPPLGLEAEDSTLLAKDEAVQGLWAQLSEAEWGRVLWLARQAENALKRFWCQERRFYSRAEALVVLDEGGEWVEREIEDTEARDALEAVLERLYAEQRMERLWERLDQVERAIVAGLREGKSQVEIAQALGITQSAVVHRLQKVRAKAQAILAAMGENRGRSLIICAAGWLIKGAGSKAEALPKEKTRMKAMGLKSKGLAMLQKVQMRAKCPSVWRGRWVQLHIVQRLLFPLFAGRRGWLITSSAIILLAMLAIEIVASPCDPRVPRDCNDPPPPVGNSCAPGCMWTDDGIFPRWVGDLCRFRSLS